MHLPEPYNESAKITLQWLKDKVDKLWSDVNWAEESIGWLNDKVTGMLEYFDEDPEQDY